MNRCHATVLSGSLFFLLLCASSPAVLVMNWVVDQGSPATSNMNTASPTIGNGTAENADAAIIHSDFPAVSLNSGDLVMLTGSVTLTGITASNQNLRFGLFDRLGSPDVNGWLGYFVSVSSGAGAGQVRQRTAGNTALFLSNTGSAVVASTANAPHSSNGAVLADGTYGFSLQFARDGSNYDITASITGGANNLSNTFLLNDLPPVAGETFTFNNVGFLLGDGLNTDQAQFSNIDVTLVPEPASVSFLTFGSLLVFSRRRRQSNA